MTTSAQRAAAVKNTATRSLSSAVCILKICVFTCMPSAFKVLIFEVILLFKIFFLFKIIFVFEVFFNWDQLYFEIVTIFVVIFILLSLGQKFKTKIHFYHPPATRHPHILFSDDLSFYKIYNHMDNMVEIWFKSLYGRSFPVITFFGC